MLVASGLILLGLILLVGGGELLIRGASRLALSFGISSLVVGLTVVAFGTSAPELVVSIKAALDGAADIAIANVVGSNIFNILLILGVCSLALPLTVSRSLIKLDVPVMIGAALLLWLFSGDGKLLAWEGMTLFALIVVYTTYLLKSSKSIPAKGEELAADSPAAFDIKTLLGNIALIAGGLALLVLGGNWLVDGAITLATGLGVSERVIGLTIVAAGTSLPELVTSILATIKGERDIAIGNVVGSNIYNIFAILGLSSTIPKGGLVVSSEMLAFDVPLMVGISALSFIIFYTGKRISRTEGFVMLAGYVAYTVYLIG